MMARIQQATVLFIVLASFAWLAVVWPRSPWLALAGVLVLTCGHALFLALEFVLVYRVNQRDPAPLADHRKFLKAWLYESMATSRVFAWQQPFRHDAWPDRLEGETVRAGRRGVVLIHGFFCNRGFWNPWIARLEQGGHAHCAVTMEPIFGSISDYVPIIDAAVTKVTAATGMPPLLICHSMGGLAARAWVRAGGDMSRVWHIVTLGTPHHGTWLGRFSHAMNGRQMKLGSRWLKQLERHEAAGPPGTPGGAERYAKYVCWYSNTDNIVFPTSVASLPGADNRFVEGIGHVALAFDKAVMRDVFALLETT